MNDFSGRIVVITGGASGIGLAFGRGFGREGAKVVIADRREDRLSSAADELRRDGIDVATFECDVVDRSRVEALAEFVDETVGLADVIVNNAGIRSPISTVIDADLDDAREVIDVNLFGVWNGIAVFGKRFRERGRPSAIYNVGSENSLFDGLPYGSSYIASKHALLGLTDALRREVPAHVAVSLICPGFVDTDLTGRFGGGMSPDEFVRIALPQLKAGRFFVVSHPYNAVRIQERFDEISEAYARYAPRHADDVEYDVRTLVQTWFGSSKAT